MKILVAALVAAKQHALHQPGLQALLQFQADVVVLLLHHITQPIRHLDARCNVFVVLWRGWMQKVQNGGVFHRTRPGNHLCNLSDLRCDKNRHIGEEQSDEIKSFCLVLPQFIPVNILKL